VALRENSNSNVAAAAIYRIGLSGERAKSLARDRDMDVITFCGSSTKLLGIKDVTMKRESKNKLGRQ
jgi:hypothetical protein